MTTITTPRMHPAERFGYLMATRPRLRRVTIFWSTSQILTLWSIVAAPPAFASTMAGVLNWTGVTDSYGVPLGNYYLSVVSTREAITEAGPDLSLNPTSWARWLGNAVVTGVSHDTVVNWLQAQVSVYVFMITIALWLLRFAMSSTWLYWLATWFRPLFEALRTLLIDMWIFPICLTLGLAYGAFQMLWHGRRGHGWSIMLSSIAIGIIGIVLVWKGDPLGDLSSDHGLLFQARTLAFTVAQGAINNGSLIHGADNAANLNHLTGVTADAVLRHPLQLLNFGMVVDNVGSCSGAYSQALMAGDAAKPSMPSIDTPGLPVTAAADALPFIGGGDHAGPAHAMAKCGLPQALAHAQQLDFGSFSVGLGFLLLGLIFTFFICYVTYSYVMVCGAAFLNAFLALFAAGPAMIAGKPRQRAKHRLKEFFKHAFLVFVYVLYVAFASVIILKTVAPGGYASQVGMNHPVAQLVMIAIMSAVAIGLFWWLKKEVGDHTREDLVHAVHQIIDKTREGYQKGQDTIDRGKDALARGAEFFNRGKGDNTDDDDDDQPLTGAPVDGRSGVNKPTTSNPSELTDALPVSAGSGDGAGAASGAAETATTVAAPEAALGAAVLQNAQQGRQQHSQQSTGRSANSYQLSGSAPPVINANGGHHSFSMDPDQSAPAAGRSDLPASQGGQRRLPPPPSDYPPVYEPPPDWDDPAVDDRPFDGGLPPLPGR